MADYITDIIARYEADLQKVKQDGYALQFVKEQTPEICLVTHCVIHIVIFLFFVYVSRYIYYFYI